jgi:hypothetical protein
MKERNAQKLEWGEICVRRREHFVTIFAILLLHTCREISIKGILLRTIANPGEFCMSKLSAKLKLKSLCGFCQNMGKNYIDANQYKECFKNINKCANVFFPK